MATQYFRITAYNEKENYTVILDSNGYFEKLWEFSVYIRDKGFDVIEVDNDERFLDGNIQKVKPDKNKFYLRAKIKGKPTYTAFTVDNTKYKAVKIDDKIYIPDKTVLA